MTIASVFLLEKLIWKSCRPQNKTLIRGASLGKSCKLRDKEAICSICGRSSTTGKCWYGNWNRHVCHKQKRSTEGCSKFKSPETRQVQERLVSTLEHMQVPKWDRTMESMKWKYEVDRPSRLTEVNSGKKQKVCSLSCLWSQVNGIHLAQVIIKLWFVYGQNIIDIPMCLDWVLLIAVFEKAAFILKLRRYAQEYWGS